MSRSIFFLIVFLQSISFVNGQDAVHQQYTSEFIEVEGARMHYLDFGGDGLPVILVHSEGWDAYTYKEFGSLLADHNRVFAVTRPGYGDSEKGIYDVPSQGDYLMSFIDALGIEKAIFIGNASASSELTYLAEHYPGQIAGVVYLSGLAVPWLDIYSEDPTRAFEMFARAGPGNPNKEEIAEARSLYRPKYLTTDSIVIEVPALAFVSQSGRKGTEEGVGALVLAGSPLMEEVRNRMPPSPEKTYLDRIAQEEDFRNEMLNKIQDTVAREYFIRLANDTILQRKVYQFHIDKILPAKIAAQDALIQAYGDNLILVRLDVSQIIGYEYRNSPHLILDHIREFLRELSKS